MQKFFFFFKALNQNHYTASCKGALPDCRCVRSLAVKLCPVMIHSFHRTLLLTGKCTLHCTPPWRALRTQRTGCCLITFDSLGIIHYGGTQNWQDFLSYIKVEAILMYNILIVAASIKKFSCSLRVVLLWLALKCWVVLSLCTLLAPYF